MSRVFPPCDTTQLAATVGDREGKEVSSSFASAFSFVTLYLMQVRILSIGQFRLEKDHPLQIKAMFELRQIITEEEWANVRLVIVGGCRNQEDWKLVQDLKDLTKYLSVEDNVEFKVNLPFPDLLSEFSKALIGMHTMHQEHFGIGIVEMMSAGLLTVANRSGGPLMDIVVEDQVRSRLILYSVILCHLIRDHEMGSWPSQLKNTQHTLLIFLPCLLRVGSR